MGSKKVLFKNFTWIFLIVNLEVIFFSAKQKWNLMLSFKVFYDKNLKLHGFYVKKAYSPLSLF